MEQRLLNLIATASEFGAAKAFADAGLTTGEVSHREALRRYGKFFSDLQASGQIRPCRTTGTARNSKRLYRVADILAAKTAAEAQALLLDTNPLKSTI